MTCHCFSFRALLFGVIISGSWCGGWVLLGDVFEKCLCLFCGETVCVLCGFGGLYYVDVFVCAERVDVEVGVVFCSEVVSCVWVCGEDGGEVLGEFLFVCGGEVDCFCGCGVVLGCLEFGWLCHVCFLSLCGIEFSFGCGVVWCFVCVFDLDRGCRFASCPDCGSLVVSEALRCQPPERQTTK